MIMPIHHPRFVTADGEVTLEAKFRSRYLSGTKWDTARGFSNNKKLNRIKVTIKKSNEVLNC
jgi:hypothetical protein